MRSSGVLFASGVSTPSYKTTGLRFMYWSNSLRNFKRIPCSRIPGLTSGCPIAPKSIESLLPSCSMSKSVTRSPDFKYLSPPKSFSTKSNSTLNFDFVCSKTLIVSSTTSGPVPSPPIIDILYFFILPIQCIQKRFN